MTATLGERSADHEILTDLAPALRRAVGLDSQCVVRFRFRGGRATALIRLPFEVLVSRSVAGDAGVETRDITVRAAEALAWLDVDGAEAPLTQDALWRSGLPPEYGWVRLETVPDDVIRALVRSGAATLKQAAAREGDPGARPRAEVSDALLDSVVLTATTDADGAAPISAAVTLRAMSALTRMGFLPQGGHAFVDSAGRWARVVAEYGTVYLERPGSGLTVR
ncbi:MAG: hypothetical protein ACR2LX_12015 [Jatrophihabitans sp.]